MSHAESKSRATPASRHPVLHDGPPPEGFVDAVIAAGALAAWADSRVRAVERVEMLVYLRRCGLSSLRRRDVMAVFDRRVRELERNPPCAMRAAWSTVQHFAGSSLAWTVSRAAEHVAAADGFMQESEWTAIRFVMTALGLPADSLEQRPASVTQDGRN